MATQAKKNKVATPSSEQVFIQSQIDQAIKTFLTQFTLMVQALTVLVVADVTILGYAVSQQLAGLIFVGSFIPIAIMYILYASSRFMLPVVYAAAVLESQIPQNGYDLLASSFLAYVISPKFLAQLKQIGNGKDIDTRMAELHKLGFPIFRRPTFNTILFLISIIQLLLPFLLNKIFGWRLF